jgi:hypothetical protein
VIARGGGGGGLKLSGAVEAVTGTEALAVVVARWKGVDQGVVNVEEVPTSAGTVEVATLRGPCPHI